METLHSNSLKSLDELREELDETLFCSIMYKSRPSSRPHTHNFTLQAAVTKKNYLDRMLFFICIDKSDDYTDFVLYFSIACIYCDM